tara:strand:- start:48 stop:1304 length:1257 start_codon:yes stop_codon:yes gene_type:complete
MSTVGSPTDSTVAAGGWGERLRSLRAAMVAHGIGFRIPIFTWGTAYFLLWCYRTLFSVLGEVIIARFTSIADTRSYQRQGITNLVDQLGASSSEVGFLAQSLATSITKVVGGLIGFVTFGNAIAVNIGFQTIGFIGLLALLRAVDPQERKALYAMVMLPSITVWSSIASKEALLFFFVGIVCAHVVRIYKNTDRPSVLLFVCVVMVWVFKPHFMPAVILLLSVSYVARRFDQKATLALLALGASLFVLYVFRDQVDEFARYVDWALLSMGGNSARDPFIVEKYDVFLKAPLGMYLSFMGPTLAEASKGVLHIITFSESLFILALMLFFFLKRLPSIPVYSLILSMSVLFWILFTTYPPAVSNPGTAIRYRTGYILIVFICAVVLPSRGIYVEWLRGWRLRAVARSFAKALPAAARPTG